MNYKLLGMIIVFHQILVGLPGTIGKSFDIFVKDSVPACDQQEFSLYYQELMKEVEKTQKGPQRKAFLDSVRYVALSDLEIKDVVLFRQLEEYLYPKSAQDINNKQLKEINTFLVRYGALEQYKRNQCIAQSTTLYRVQSFFKNIGNTFSCWVSSVKNSFQKKTFKLV